MTACGCGSQMVRSSVMNTAEMKAELRAASKRTLAEFGEGL